MLSKEYHVRIKISEEVKKNKEQLRENLRIYKEEYSEIIANNSEALIKWRGDLIELYADTIPLEEDEAVSLVKEWGTEVSDYLVNINMPLDLAIEEIRYYRNLIGDLILQEAEKEEINLKQFYQLISSFDAIVDQAVEIISVSYMKRYNQNMTSSQKEIKELSVPIIEVSKDIGVLPLVGEVDTERAQTLMDHALKESSENEYDYLILDVSGVPVIDTMVAHQIFKVISALTLTGVQVKMSGIRPEIAQTMVQLGVNFEDTLSFSSLHRALEYIGFSFKKSK